MQRNQVLLAAATAALAMTGAANAAVFPELEPNDTKAAANVVAGMVAGDSIVGNSILATGAGVDYFDVRTGALAPGIYQHRLTITTPGAVGHVASLRGVSITAAPADTLPGIPWDGVVGVAGAGEISQQGTSTTTNPPRFNQWYGFGKGERMHYRVNGVAATTADYTATMTTTPVVATPVGAYQPGLITIATVGQGHTTDTEMFVYDSNFNAMVGYNNDDESTLAGTPGVGSTNTSWLPRNYAVGTYYLALATFGTHNNQPAPSDDDFRTSGIMEFPDIIVNNDATAGENMAFTISDGVTTLAVPNTRVGAFDVNWFSFTVVPEPTSLALVGMAVPMLLRRRKA